MDVVITAALVALPLTWPVLKFLNMGDEEHECGGKCEKCHEKTET